jgi:ABC-type lipoprotein release transport system permease subunit
MNLPFYIARRYLFAKKSRNAINIISFISMTGVAVGTAALVVVLSVFNGFDGVIRSLINSFDPDLKITLLEGKTFDPEAAGKSKILELPGVLAVSEVLEENALIRYDERQYIAVMKGVDEHYPEVTGVDSMIRDGEFILTRGNEPMAVVGQGIAYNLHVGLTFIKPLIFYVPKRTGNINLANATASFNRAAVFPSGVFSIEQDFDSRYIILPIATVRNLLEYSTEVSALEISLEKGSSPDKIREQIQAFTGDNFSIKTRQQQNEVFYRIMRSEKWATFLILTLILIIASFNIIGSLSMLIIDKKDDIATLQNLGAGKSLIHRIFLVEGWLISIFGSLAGVAIGTIITLIQEHFELIRLGGSGTFIIDAYPVHYQLGDIILVWLTVLIIGFLAAWFPASKIQTELLVQTNREE